MADPMERKDVNLRGPNRTWIWIAVIVLGVGVLFWLASREPGTGTGAGRTETYFGGDRDDLVLHVAMLSRDNETAIRNAIEDLPGVDDVDFDFDKQQVTVQRDDDAALADETVIGALERAGFRVSREPFRAGELPEGTPDGATPPVN